MDAVRTWWRVTGEEVRREQEDERERLLRLLAIRDAFLALTLAMVGLVVAMLVREERGGDVDVSPLAVEAMLLGAWFVAMAIGGVSRLVRGAALGVGTVQRHGIYSVVGLGFAGFSAWLAERFGYGPGFSAGMLVAQLLGMIVVNALLLAAARSRARSRAGD